MLWTFHTHSRVFKMMMMMMLDILQRFAAALSHEHSMKAASMMCAMMIIIYMIHQQIEIWLLTQEKVRKRCNVKKWNGPSPIGTRVGHCGERILFGGKGKTIRSSIMQIRISSAHIAGSLVHSALGWAQRCWQALSGSAVVEKMIHYYTQG